MQLVQAHASMASDSVLMKHVAPALGVLVACMLFASPIKAVRGVRFHRQLGVRVHAYKLIVLLQATQT